MAMLTDKDVTKAMRDAKSAGADIYLTDAQRARGIGRLRVRARPTGQCMFYFRYSDSTGKQDSVPLGVYDAGGTGGLTLRAAREKAGDLSKLYQGGVRDLRAYLEHRDAQQRAQIETEKRAREEAERQAKAGTLEALLKAYVAHLERQGKQSAQDVRNIFKRNVVEEWPHLAAMRAVDITHKDVSAILAKLIDRGAGRTAGKLRSYLRAAFASALAAESDPTMHPALHGFALTTNPAAIVPAKTLSAFNRARDRVLTESEMHPFLKRLHAAPDSMAKDAVMLTLLLGGQRMAQLVRARPQDVDADACTITLFDPKGARKQPRPHCLPMTAGAAEIVARYVDRTDDGGQHLPYLFTSTQTTKNGRVPIRTETVSELVTAIVGDMMKAKEVRVPFELRDLRRTCETMLARMGVSKDHRAQLQSHGLGGVQDRHYDRHTYMDEKRAALESWAAKLEQMREGKTSAKVVPMRAKR